MCRYFLSVTTLRGMADLKRQFAELLSEKGAGVPPVFHALHVYIKKRILWCCFWWSCNQVTDEGLRAITAPHTHLHLHHHFQSVADEGVEMLRVS